MDYKDSGFRIPLGYSRPDQTLRSRWARSSLLVMLSAVFALLALQFLRFTAAQTSVDSYIATESPIVKTNLLNNIGAAGATSEGAYSGIGQ